MKIIVTIPAYNEEKSLGKVIEDIKKVMTKEKYKYEVLVVNDGSRDRTVEVAKSAGAIVVSHPYNMGLAETFRTEMKVCLERKADVIVHTDADGQYLAEDIPKLLEPLKRGDADMVLGSRFKGKIESMPALKMWGNKAFSRVISKITKLKISDGQTGFRAFTKEVAAALPVISTHTYTQETIIRAARHKFRIWEVPVYFAKRDGKSRLISNPLEYAFRAWINIFRIYRDHEPLRFFGLIGLGLVSMGTIVGLLLIYNFITTGKVGHIPSTILSMLLIVTGLQIILFGFLADMNKK
ncbi:MAG: glycosyltransferase family 2 protein [Candidatus Nanoarchaeia archaeon]